MYLELDRRLVYLAHPKTASQAVRAALLERGFVPVVEARGSRPYQLRTRSPWSHHCGLEAHPGEDWTVFTTVRNHFDALASWYAFTRSHTSHTWARNFELDVPFVSRLLETWPEYFPDRRRLWGLHAPVADVVLRYTEQEEGLRELLEDPELELERVNVSEARAGRSYRDMISSGLRSYVEGRFAEELEELGFAW